MPNKINFIDGKVETPISVMVRAITKEDTWCWQILHFVRIIGMKILKTKTSEYFEEKIVWGFLKKA